MVAPLVDRFSEKLPEDVKKSIFSFVPSDIHQLSSVNRECRILIGHMIYQKICQSNHSACLFGALDVNPSKIAFDNPGVLFKKIHSLTNQSLFSQNSVVCPSQVSFDIDMLVNVVYRTIFQNALLMAQSMYSPFEWNFRGLCGDSVSPEDAVQRLYSSVQNLSPSRDKFYTTEKKKILKIDEKLTFLPVDFIKTFEPTHLVLSNVLIKKIPKNIGALSTVREIDIANCPNLKSVTALSSLPQLSSISIHEGCLSLKKLSGTKFARSSAPLEQIILDSSLKIFDWSKVLKYDPLGEQDVCEYFHRLLANQKFCVDTVFRDVEAIRLLLAKRGCSVFVGKNRQNVRDMEVYKVVRTFSCSFQLPKARY